MKRHLSITSLLLMAVAPLAAQESALPYLPKDTLLAVSVPDFAGSMHRFGQMPLAKMWAEEEVQNFVADLRTLVEQKWKEGLEQAKEMHAQGAMPVDPADLLDLRMGGCTFALTKLRMEVGDFGPKPDIGLVAHIDFGSSGATWNKLLKVGMSMLDGAIEGHATKATRKVGDVEIVSIVPSTEGTDMTLEIAMLPNGLLIGTIGAEVQGILESMQKKTPVLGATAGFAADTRTTPECQMYFSSAPWGRFALDLLRIGEEMGQLGEVDVDGIERALNAMGCLKEHHLTATSSYVEGKCETRLHHRHEPGTSSSKLVDTKFLKWVPKDAVGFSASTVDVGSSYDALVKGLNAYDEKLAKQALDQLAKLEEQLGFSIRGDLLGSIGNQIVNWSMPMTTLATPELAIVVEMKDQAKFVKAVKGIAQMTQGILTIEEGDKRGVTAYQVKIDADRLGGGMGRGMMGMMGGLSAVLGNVKPTFAFKDGYMVVGLSPSDVKRVFQRMDREDDPKGDVRSNKEFAAVAATLPQGVQSISFSNWKSNFESFYGIASGLLAAANLGTEMPIDLAQLPDSSTLTKHLFASISYSTTGADGTTTVSTSPFGPEIGLGIFVLGLGVAVLVPNLNRGF